MSTEIISALINFSNYWWLTNTLNFAYLYYLLSINYTTFYSLHFKNFLGQGRDHEIEDAQEAGVVTGDVTSQGQQVEIGKEQTTMNVHQGQGQSQNQVAGLKVDQFLNLKVRSRKLRMEMNSNNSSCFCFKFYFIFTPIYQP